MKADVMAARALATCSAPAARRYAILGHDAVAKNCLLWQVSPRMQSEAFASRNLPHAFVRADVATVDAFVRGPIWNAEEFGGCAVTIPHKLDIMDRVDSLTDAAREIGAVSVITIGEREDGSRTLIGDNADWNGIYEPLRRRLGDDMSGEGGRALIVGGGSFARVAAYAARKLDLGRVYFNPRSPDRAEAMAEEFGGTVVGSLDEDPGTEGSLGLSLAGEGGMIRAVVSTLPAVAEFKLPEWMLAGGSGHPLPIVFDVNYRPYDTAVLLQARGAGCDVVHGLEMLWEQGAGQFESWTGTTAPRDVMRGVVLEDLLPSSEGRVGA